jgi:hypothetical protein
MRSTPAFVFAKVYADFCVNYTQKSCITQAFVCGTVVEN